MAGWPDTLAGSGRAEGRPTAASVADVTEVTADRTPAGSAVVPSVATVAWVPVCVGLEARAEAGPPLTLTTIMVAMATRTSPTGMSAVSIGCLARKLLGVGGAVCAFRAFRAEAG